MSAAATPLFSDISLARRLESLCAAEMDRFVASARVLDPASAAVSLEVGGGIAAFIAPDSPVNQAFGVGMHDPATQGDIATIEEFYLSRGARPLMGVCPLAHPETIAALGSRGWVVDGFENVLCRPVGRAGDPAFAVANERVEIREAVTAADRELWKMVAATGFSAPLPPLDEQLALGEIVIHRLGSVLLLAFIDGRPAGTAELFITDEIAWLSADATLPAFRRRGVQRALQAYRLARAAEAGCAIAVTEAAPGGPSQRNMHRMGFEVAYTRADLTKPV